MYAMISSQHLKGCTLFILWAQTWSELRVSTNLTRNSPILTLYASRADLIGPCFAVRMLGPTRSAQGLIDICLVVGGAMYMRNDV